jgi:hypothetical protein
MSQLGRSIPRLEEDMFGCSELDYYRFDSVRERCRSVGFNSTARSCI